ncbi:MAG: alpha-L-fucosidase, partial [Akkermansiaceae bacterium]
MNTQQLKMTARRMIAITFMAVLTPAFAKEEVPRQESLNDYNARVQWFAKADYGMFIHFGLYSQLGGVWKGKQVAGYAEWIQGKANIDRDEYAGLAKAF